MSAHEWSGVFPAATTQYKADMSVDIEATKAVVDNLIRDGIHGVIAMGTVGENNSLKADEKRDILKAIVDTVAGRIPVITGVSELTTDLAASYAKDAETIGADGLMLLPAMVYVPSEAELEMHIRTVAAASNLSIMLYNNPPAYRVSISLETLQRLSDVRSLIAIKESAPDPRRITDIINACGDRYLVFAGLDDVALEELVLGACGWVSGLTNAFPKESIALWDAFKCGDMDEALAIYRWFMPLLHLDAEHDLVQSIKLAEQVMGRGSERVRMPRMVLEGARRAEVIKMVETARDNRPVLRELASAEQG